MTAAPAIPAPPGCAYLPFQAEGIRFAVEHPCVLLADEAGLGKTIQAIGTINATQGVRSVLCVCPCTVKSNWRTEALLWLVDAPSWDIVVAHTRQDAAALRVARPSDRPQFHIINYDLLDTLAPADAPSPSYDMMIADECTYVKNPKAIRSKAFMRITAARKLALSGTPIENRPIELQNILKWLDRETWVNRWKFALRYCDAHQTRFGVNMMGASNLSELQGRLKATLMIRRLKKDVLPSLPPKWRQVIEVPDSRATEAVSREWSKYRTVVAKVDALKEAVEKARISQNDAAYTQAVQALNQGRIAAFGELASVRRDTAVAKIPLVVEHLDDCLASSSKVVLFYHHRDVGAAIAQHFGKAAVMVDGATPGLMRAKAVSRFQEDPAVKLFLGSITAAGMGITLTAGCHVVFAELDWVPSRISQCEDRCARIGQVYNVLVQHIVLEGSLDAVMAKRIVAKQRILDAALDSPILTADASEESPLVPSRDSQSLPPRRA